jgi:hypothetical protein
MMLGSLSVSGYVFLFALIEPALIGAFANDSSASMSPLVGILLSALLCEVLAVLFISLPVFALLEWRRRSVESGLNRAREARDAAVDILSSAASGSRSAVGPPSPEPMDNEYTDDYSDRIGGMGRADRGAKFLIIDGDDLDLDEEHEGEMDVVELTLAAGSNPTSGGGGANGHDANLARMRAYSTSATVAAQQQQHARRASEIHITLSPEPKRTAETPRNKTKGYAPVGSQGAEHEIAAEIEYDQEEEEDMP